jgi:hypothetical protein
MYRYRPRPKYMRESQYIYTSLTLCEVKDLEKDDTAKRCRWWPWRSDRVCDWLSGQLVHVLFELSLSLSSRRTLLLRPQHHKQIAKMSSSATPPRDAVDYIERSQRWIAGAQHLIELIGDPS